MLNDRSLRFSRVISLIKSMGYLVSSDVGLTFGILTCLSFGHDDSRYWFEVGEETSRIKRESAIGYAVTKIVPFFYVPLFPLFSLQSRLRVHGFLSTRILGIRFRALECIPFACIKSMEHLCYHYNSGGVVVC